MPAEIIPLEDLYAEYKEICDELSDIVELLDDESIADLIAEKQSEARPWYKRIFGWMVPKL
jgi:predicted nuclease with TOPRIM domain